jgi:NitT/TauT family transport system ATP-binding protein
MPAAPIEGEADTVVVAVKNLRKSYGHGETAHLAIAGVTFDVAKGEFVCIVGPSGCGKTTLLRCLSGLIAPSEGGVELHGERVTAPPAAMGVVFQEYNRSLLPWTSVRRNVELPLRKKIRGRAERTRAVDEALAAVGLTGAGDRYPWQLSGGMQQRVAIARAIAYRPEILLMDEPFASVDAQTRIELEDLILRVRADFAMTVLFVTHDIDEAVYLGDRVVVLSPPPCTVQEVLDVPLARPRNQTETKALPEYAALRAHVYREILGDGKR